MNVLPAMTRRRLLGAALGGAVVPVWAAADEDPASLIRSGGVVVAFRHALAPGTFDPPQFRLGDCSTQRNLNDEGRAQARRIGAWFESRTLRASQVRSSPYCRCLDTATLAFGRVQPWAALGSPRGASETTNAESLVAMRQALADAAGRPERFEIWVTHMFVLAALVGANVSSGEGLVLRADADGSPRLLARLMVA